MADWFVNTDDQGTRLIAGFGWGLDEYEFKGEVSNTAEEAKLRLSITVSGDQDSEEIPCGDSIETTILGTVSKESDEWVPVDQESEGATPNDDEDDDY